MRKNILKIGAALMLCASSLCVQAQSRLVFDTPKNHVGEVIFQQPATVVFTYKNKGKEPIRITEVAPSCGCTSVEWTREEIASGEKGQISVLYDALMLGTFFKELAVYTSDSPVPQYLSMEGRVVTHKIDVQGDFPIEMGNIRVNTNYVEFDDVNRGDHPVAELQVVNLERSPYRPTLMHLPNYLSAQYIPEVIAGGRTGRIRITLDSEKLGLLGLNQTRIYLSRYMGDKVSETNEILVSAVLLPSFANLTADQLATAPRMELSQEELTFVMGGKKKQTQTITVRNEGQETLDIRSVQVFNQSIEVSLSNRSIQPGKSAQLKVTLLAKYLKKAKNRPRLLLITNDPSKAKQAININVNN